MCACIKGPEDAAMGHRRVYPENISVRPPYWLRRLARPLLEQSPHTVKERGIEEAPVGVLTENVDGAHRLNESVEFRRLRSCTTLLKSLW